ILAADVWKYEFTPYGNGDPIRGEVVYERDEFPEDLSEKDIELHTAPATRRHMLDFLAAIDGNGRPVADIEEGHISSASCILANISMEAGRALEYDPVQYRIPGDAEATALLKREYRKPWVHP